MFSTAHWSPGWALPALRKVSHRHSIAHHATATATAAEGSDLSPTAKSISFSANQALPQSPSHAMRSSASSSSSHAAPQSSSRTAQTPRSADPVLPSVHLANTITAAAMPPFTPRFRGSMGDASAVGGGGGTLPLPSARGTGSKFQTMQPHPPPPLLGPQPVSVTALANMAAAHAIAQLVADENAPRRPMAYQRDSVGGAHIGALSDAAKRSVSVPQLNLSALALNQTRSTGNHHDSSAAPTTMSGSGSGNFAASYMHRDESTHFGGGGANANASARRQSQSTASLQSTSSGVHTHSTSGMQVASAASLNAGAGFEHTGSMTSGGDGGNTFRGVAEVPVDICAPMSSCLYIFYSVGFSTCVFTECFLHTFC